MDLKPVIRIAPTLQSVALAQNALKLIKKKRKRTKDIVETGTTTLFGTALIHEQSKLIEDF